MLNSSAGSSLPPDSRWQKIGWCFILAALYHVSASDDEEPKLWLGRTCRTMSSVFLTSLQ